MRPSNKPLGWISLALICALFLAFGVKQVRADSGSQPPDPNRSITVGYTNERFKPDPRCDPRISSYCNSERRLGVSVYTRRQRVAPKPDDDTGLSIYHNNVQVSPESLIKRQLRNPVRFDPEITFKSGWKKLIPRSVRKAMRPPVP